MSFEDVRCELNKDVTRAYVTGYPVTLNVTLIPIFVGMGGQFSLVSINTFEIFLSRIIDS